MPRCFNVVPEEAQEDPMKNKKIDHVININTQISTRHNNPNKIHSYDMYLQMSTYMQATVMPVGPMAKMSPG